MLKLWKAWGKSDVATSASTQSNDPNGNTSIRANDADDSSAPAVSLRNVSEYSDLTAAPLLRSKRDQSTRPLVIDEHVSTKRKRVELEASDLALDSIVTRLPEMAEADASARPDIGPFTVDSQRRVLISVQSRNMIAVLNEFHDLIYFSETFLRQAVSADRNSSQSHFKKRIALFMPEDNLPRHRIEIQAQSLLKSSGLSVGMFTPSEDIQSQNQWATLLDSDIVVVPAMNLLEAIITGCISLLQIHAIFICDARPVKDKEFHPIVRTMSDFYSVLDEHCRPRILACISGQFYFDATMMKLEETLKAVVFGVSDETRANLLAIPDRPHEAVVFFEQPSKHPYTLLYKQLRQMDKEGTSMYRHFSAARHALVEVGSCASDLVWRRALGDIDTANILAHDEDEGAEDEDTLDSKTSQARATAQIRSLLRNWTFAMPNLDPSSRGFNVSPKFLKLVNILRTCQPYGDTFRGIVFVQKRAVALVMVDLLRTLDMAYIRPHALVGGSTANLQAQSDIIHGFGMGTYNLLVATKCAEDLDLPKASVVVRYDIFESQVSYAYSRARTRGRESHLVHMLQRGNDTHRRILRQVTQFDMPLQVWAERVANSPRSAVPPRVLHETHDPYLSESEDEDGDEPGNYIKDPTTSGRIRLQDATGIIYRFASTLNDCDDEAAVAPLFEFEDAVQETSGQPQFICSVGLSSEIPIPRIRGPPCASISQARRVACFQTCLALFDKGLLDYHFFPQPLHSATSRRRAPEILSILEDDVDGLSSLPPKGSSQNKLNGTRSYPRKQPDFWSNNMLPSSKLNRLYPTILTTDQSFNSGEVYSPMIIMTRLPLPSLSSFKLFDSGVATDAHLRRGAAFEIDEERLYDLYRYTIRICRALLNKPFVCPLDRVPYFFAPIKSSWNDSPDSNRARWNLPSVVDEISWDLVALAARDWVVPLKSGSVQSISDDMQNAIIQDRWVEFTRRYYAIQVRPDLTPLSKPPDSQREQDYDNLVEYCKEHRKGFIGLNDYGQPLIQVDRVPAVMNCLNPMIKAASTPTKPPARYLIPELCAKFTIPASTFRTALLLPSIMRRIDDLLLVKELNATLFDHSISEHQLHAAISAPSAGLQFDYERLELLGDAYLKYLSSIYLFVTNPSQHEGALHSARLRIISNKALLLNADRAGLPPFIQAKPFVSKLWQPPNFEVLPPPQAHADPSREEDKSRKDLDDGAPQIVIENCDSLEPPRDEDGPLGSMQVPAIAPGYNETVKPRAGNESASSLVLPEGSAWDGSTLPVTVPGYRSKRRRQQEEQNIHWLGDKAVADVAEAIVGAAYVTGGREAALKASKALCIAVPRVDRWSDFGKKALAPPPDVTAKLRPGSIQAVEKIIGHKFQRPHILAQALTHASIQGYEMTCYERLEFIGDAILDFLVIRHIFDRDTQLSPGALTLLKGAMVSNSALAAVCIQAGLHEHLIFESFTLANNIQFYAENLKAKQAEEYQAAVNEDRMPGQYWLEVEPPKALSDVVESIIGAIYISDNFSPRGVEIFFDNVLKPFYDMHITLKTLSHHPTKILFELFQAQGCQLFEMVKSKTVDQQYTRCDVVVHDIVLASADDSTSALAAKRASYRALDALEGDSDFMTRTCDCRALNLAKKAQKKGFKEAMADFSDAEENAEDEDLMAVEGALAEEANGESEEGEV